nr:MAG TPA: hypothetical protein [Caudoviricetes sp.]
MYYTYAIVLTEQNVSYLTFYSVVHRVRHFGTLKNFFSKKMTNVTFISNIIYVSFLRGEES